MPLPLPQAVDHRPSKLQLTWQHVQPDLTTRKLQAEKAVRKIVVKNGRTVAAALANETVTNNERVVQALGRRQRPPSYDPLRVERALVQAGIPYHGFCPTPAPAVVAPPMTHCAHKKRKKTTEQPEKPEGKFKRARLQKLSSPLEFPSNLHKGDYQPLDDFDVVAVAGDLGQGVPFYLVNRSQQAEGEDPEGQFFGKPVRSGHFVGPYALAWDDGSKSEVQSNHRPTRSKCHPIMSKGRELVLDRVKLDRHGFLKRSSARSIARELPSAFSSLVPRDLLRGLDADCDDSSDNGSSDENDSASELALDSGEDEDANSVGEDRAEDSAEGKEVGLVAPVACFATYEEKLAAEVQALPKTRVRVARKL